MNYLIVLSASVAVLLSIALFPLLSTNYLWNLRGPSSSSSSSLVAELFVTNGFIYTSDSSLPVADSMAIRAGRVLRVGNYSFLQRPGSLLGTAPAHNANAKNYREQKTRTQDRFSGPKSNQGSQEQLQLLWLIYPKNKEKVSKRKGKYILCYLQTRVMLKGMRFSKVGQTLMLVTPIQAALPFVMTTTKFYARNLQNPDTGLRNVNASET
ncbi:hypothetical protein RHMOL_Rhmol01G0131100 [Rhododendron molle]|uniref:Uncharacterized protein n=1 Tax=Rhododendron molle TaxID=49168 RepID=A0ACC0Q2B6_RHOML|nr:hypothetical protein RHMOL_Rhmol01G0131100 [Rhododendron molle]